MTVPVFIRRFAHFAIAPPAPRVTILITSSLPVSLSSPHRHFVTIIPAVVITHPRSDNPIIALVHAVTGANITAPAQTIVDHSIPAVCPARSRFLALRSQ